MHNKYFHVIKIPTTLAFAVRVGELQPIDKKPSSAVRMNESHSVYHNVVSNRMQYDTIAG